MSWKLAWLETTHVTYGLVQAVCLGEPTGLGNLAKLQANIEHANSWVESKLGFKSKADNRAMLPESIAFRPEDSSRLLAILKPCLIDLILLKTVVTTEDLLSDLLVARNAVKERPGSLACALDILSKKLQNLTVLTGNGQSTRLKEHGWAIEAMHEARILRNCIAHGAGKWTADAVEEFSRRFPDETLAPKQGDDFAISLDDVFRYRRAARTVLNEADSLS